MTVKHFVAVDEVGRGPCAGPVVAAAIYVQFKNPFKKNLDKFEYELDQIGIHDSKKLSPHKRSFILDTLGICYKNLKLSKPYFFQFKDYKVSYSLGLKNHRQIDESNILKCALEAMDIAIEAFHLTQDSINPLVYVDGPFLPINVKDKMNGVAMIKGDSISKSIALASIIAKEYRDFLMIENSKKYPGYFFDKHKGYLTKDHKAALKKLGPSPIHRLSFKGSVV